MKVQELMENQEKVIRFNSIDEYHQFIDNTVNEGDTYHFEELEPSNGGDGTLYDVLVRVENFSHTPGRTNDPHQAETPEDLYGDTEVEWNVLGYGTGNFDTDTDFWFKYGQFPLSQNDETAIDDKVTDDQMYKR